MYIKPWKWACLLAAPLLGYFAAPAIAVDSTDFRVGAADQGHHAAAWASPCGAMVPRHDAPSRGHTRPPHGQGDRDRGGDDKVALVGIDLGRGPTEAMMTAIRREIADKAGIRHVLITGSHTHHGPVIELIDEPGLGKGKFDAAVAYSRKLPELLVEAILAADKDLKPAMIGVATESVNLNRNRHTKREPKPTDPMLAVVRFDDLDRKPIAVLVNFAAHPVMTEEKLLKYSADYPGLPQEQGGSRAGDEVRFHARGGGRHEPESRIRGRGSPRASARRSPTM